MEIIKQELGKRLTVQDVASILGVDARFVRQHYKDLGGIRLGNRVYIFFEKEVINAIQRQNEHQDTVDRTNQDQRKESQTPMRNKERSGRVGNNGKKAVTQQHSGADPHGLLAGMGNRLP